MDERLKGIFIIVASLAVPILALLNYEAIASYEWKSMGYFGVFLVMLISDASIIFPLPGLAIATVLGAFSNPLIVAVAGGVGGTIGELTGYFAGYGGSIIADGKRKEMYEKIKGKLAERHAGVIAIFTLAAIPNPFFDIAGLAAGAIRYPLWKFLLACSLGKIIKIAMFAYFGLFAIDFIL